MADITKAIVTADGTVTNLIDPTTKQSVNYRPVTTWYDGTPMSNAKCDGRLYRRKGSTYYKQVIDKDGELFLEKDTMVEMRAMSSWEILLIVSGVAKGIRLNGYYVKGDTPTPIDYFSSNTSQVDNGGSVIQIGSLKFEHTFIDNVNVRYFGLNGDEGQNVVSILNKILEYVVPNKLNIFCPAGTYNSFVSNMPFRNTEMNSGLRDFNNITVYGVGRKTVFKSQSVTGADVFQINASKNLTIKDLSVTADISSLTHSGSNGFSITNGFDNINLINVHCFNLPSVPYSDPSLNYLDGGKAFTIQSSKGNSNYHGSINIIGTAENVGYGFGHDGFVDDIYTKNISANIDIRVKRCYKGVAMAFAAPESTFSANDKTLNYNLKAVIEESQWDITMNRIFGGNFDFTILSTLNNSDLKINPLTNAPWLSSRPNTIAFNLAPVKNCNIRVNGFKKECDQKGAIGSVGSISEPLYDGSTRMAKIDINLTGSFTTDMTINTNAEGKNLEHCEFRLFNYASLPSVLFDPLKNNSNIINGIDYSPKQNTREIYFKRQPNDAESLKFMINPSGFIDLVGQRLGSIPSVTLLRLMGYNGTTDRPRFEFFNGGSLRITNTDDVSFTVSSGLSLPEGVVDGISGDIYIRVGISGGVRIPASIWFKQTISGNTGWFRLDIAPASTTVKGTVNQSTAVSNSAVSDATDLATAIALVNDLKAKLNAKLTADRNSGQQA